MKNYNKSDYAINKYSNGIVYCFADETIEVTLELYLLENPDKTESDFLELKMLSDTIYREQDRSETNQTRPHKRVPINLCGINDDSDIDPLTAYIEKIDRENAAHAIRQLLDSGELTQIQEMRFRAHFFNGKSARQIAREEGVSNKNVSKSLLYAIKKLEKIFSQMG